MIQRLNYTPKAIEDLEVLAKQMQPGTEGGLRYLIKKMRQAQAFILPDYGQLMDRSKPSPELPADIFHPPFNSVVLEYAAPDDPSRRDPVYTAVASSRRISVAWEWEDVDFFGSAFPMLKTLGPGVCIASISYLDEHREWMPIAGAMHIPYSGVWEERSPAEMNSPFLVSSIAHGRVSPAQARARTIRGTPIPLILQAICAAVDSHGSKGMMDSICADLMDEVNAYQDLCLALACKNVSTEVIPAPVALQAARRAGKKPPLFDYHVLKLADQVFGGAGDGKGKSPRSHLRRGHIRRLGPDRLTWVSQTMVHGRGGFVDKSYAVEAGHGRQSR